MGTIEPNTLHVGDTVNLKCEWTTIRVAINWEAAEAKLQELLDRNEALPDNWLDLICE